METLLGAIQVIISVVLIFLVLLHSGKDAGLSGAFGIGQSGSAFDPDVAQALLVHVLEATAGRAA